MSSLFKNLRIHQIFGANTDVGKTIFTTALVSASAARNHPVFYLKPVSTGPPQEADDGHIKRYAKSNLVHTDCLFRYDEPVSPHLAAKLKAREGNSIEIPSDRTIVNSIANRIRQYAGRHQQCAHVYMETAGGVHSPSLSGTSQADCYRPLFLPTVLIGDSKLGGISSTISSYESLLLRGYIVDAVLLFRDEYYRNWEYLEQYFAEKGIHISTVNAPPPRLPDVSADQASTQEYYDHLIKSASSGGINAVLDHLDQCHSKRIEELVSMPKRTLDTIWWPFVQHGLSKLEKDVTVIDSAYSDFFSVYKHKKNQDQSLLTPEFDGSASWWTQTVGHAHPSLTLAAARASGRYGHVMFPQATHLPALKLAERLVHNGPGKGWATRAFYSDNGSTGMEVAIKMALRAYCRRHDISEGDKKQLGVLGLNGSYHGDTIGAMDACAEGVYSCEWHEAKGFWFDPPSIGIANGRPGITLTPALSDLIGEKVIPAPSLSWIYDVESRLQTHLAESYYAYVQETLKRLENQGQKLGTLVLEPLVMGAGGMVFVDPLFQRIMVDVVRGRTENKQSSEWSGLPVIFDEVRTCPLSVTLASEPIFEAFLGDSKASALLHGHSYTAHAIGCEVANETLQIIDTLKAGQDWKDARAKWAQGESPKDVWSFWDPNFVQTISQLPVVDEVMALGCVLAIKLNSGSDTGYVSMSAQATFAPLQDHIADTSELSAAPGGAPFTTHYRTLGNVAYFMTSLNTCSSVVGSLEDKIWHVLSRA
ncbi:hypothetical protein D9756_003299 [Leucocoprinus leucothites]|uniref:Onanonoxo-7-onima-8-eninoihtemlysoneda n=1 Tax=Leucocoprinus leucothites TaxID=201217 RepID=A0A8H5G785_9AGAR|nr:hypothetical protein D9756_003299 [Leucoagaricus leucothites]